MRDLQVNVRLPDGVRERMKELAKANLRSMNSEIVLAVNAWLEQAAKAAGKEKTGHQA